MLTANGTSKLKADVTKKNYKIYLAERNYLYVQDLGYNPKPLGGGMKTILSSIRKSANERERKKDILTSS
jgi:hypothetical protein